MRDVYKEYVDGKITWEKAYLIANNNAASTACLISPSAPSEVDYWAGQMEDLAVALAAEKMKELGYEENSKGELFRPGEDQDRIVYD